MTVDEEAFKISDVFDIRQTLWGGRACFSNRDLKKGDVVLKADNFMGTSISHEFRKEVCHYCFTYSNGKTMKVKISPTCVYEKEEKDQDFHINNKKFIGAGLWFCSNSCRESYLNIPNIIELICCYESLLESFNMLSKSKGSGLDDEENKLNKTTIDIEIIERTWEEISVNWIPTVEKTKPTKKQKYLPNITEEIYACCRFVAETLYKIRHLSTNSSTLVSFMNLQSNEVLKISRFPILLQFQTEVFKVLKILLPEPYRNMLTIPLFRHILGSEYGNSFGIWEEGESVDSREYLGYWVFPQASYFNHTCDPNITKSRDGRNMLFISNREISAGDELNIDYSGVLDLPVIERRKCLSDNWFFMCRCNKCELDLQLVH